MHSPILAFSALAAILAFQDPSVKTDGIDFTKIERKLKSEPKYESTPKYALLVLGAEGRTRLWMALDVVVGNDVVYVDKDGDGNLGEEGERFAATKRDHDRVIADIGRIEVGDEKTTLEDFKIYTRLGGGERPVALLAFKLNAKVKVFGGYGPNGGLTQWGDSLEKAPILHANPWGPLSFFHAGPAEMPIGREATVMFYVGTRGSGDSTFLAVDEDFLDLDKDKILVTVIAKDAKGNVVSKRAQLKEHC